MEIDSVSFKLQALFCEMLTNLGLSVAEFTVYGTYRG